MVSYTIQKTFFKVSDFISWQKAGNLRLTPKFQRRSVWKQGAKSFFIDTIVRGLPVPIIFLRDVRIDSSPLEPVREIVDGQQRLRTILGYISPNLLKDFNEERDAFLVKKTHNIALAGLTFDKLDIEIRQSILDYEFNVHVLPAKVDDRQIIEIFRRMNSTNYELNHQELRNAAFYGEFKTCVYKLAEEQLHRWRKWNTFTDDKISRMAEVELTVECVLTMINGAISGKSKAAIDNAFKIYDEVFKKKNIVEKRFREVLDIIDENFKGNSSEFAFFKNTLIYTFFSFIYELAFGLDMPIGKTSKQKTLSAADIEGIWNASRKIQKRTAPNEVLNATDRRTTNPMERKILFKYLKSCVKNAKTHK